MGREVFIIFLTLVAYCNARKHLICQASKGSFLYNLFKDKPQSFTCASHLSVSQVSHSQYNEVVKRLERVERELSSTRIELAGLAAVIKQIGGINTTGIPGPVTTDYTSHLSTTIFPNKVIPSITPSPTTLRRNRRQLHHIKRKWTKSGNMYYKYFPRRKKSYQGAKKRCERRGARLASKVLRDTKVIRDLTSAGVVIFARADTWLWIGYNDIVTEGDWIWSDGGSVNGNTTDWWPGEPNQYRGNEDCGCIVAVRDGKILLNDCPCHASLPYICEIEIPENFSQ